MRKGIKILGKVLSAAVLLLIILPLALSLLLDIPAVQNYVMQKAVRMGFRTNACTNSGSTHIYCREVCRRFIQMTNFVSQYTGKTIECLT